MTAIKVCLVTILMTVIYVLASVLLSNTLFFKSSNGSLIIENNNVLGSELIGQNFTQPVYFHNRLSSNNYKNDISGNSNLPYFSKTLKDKTFNTYKKYVDDFKTNNISLNLATESASGLDPHITYDDAIIQAGKISAHSRIDKHIILNIINKSSRPRILNLFGEKIVNVLELNIELKKILEAKSSKVR